MLSGRVNFVSGGVARWGAPVPISETEATFNYETDGIARLAFEGGPSLYLKGFISGMDDITAEGAVPRGYGHLVFEDLEGHALHGKVEWFMEGDQDRGTFRFTSGTGKFAGAEGEIAVSLVGMPGDLSAPFPPKGPATFVGLTEGDGTLSLPQFEG